MAIAKSEGSVFLLTPGTGTWRFVCVGMDDATLPAGDTNTVYTLGPDYGSWIPDRIVHGAPGAPSTSLTLRLESTRDEILRIVRGPVGVRVNFSTHGSRSDPLNYSSALFLLGGEVSERSISAPVSLDPSTDVVEARVTFNFTQYLLWEPLSTRTLSNRAVIAVNAEPSRPGSACEESVECLQKLYAIDSSHFLMSKDGGLSWTSTTLTVTPTTVAKYGKYYFVGGGVSNAPAAIARSANGVNFTVTSLSTANDAVVTDFARATNGTLYATTSDGKIFYSTNSGASWSVAYSGTPALKSIVAGSVWVVAVGEDGAVVYGRGTSFNSATVGTDDLVSVAENYRNIFVLMSATSAILWGPQVPPTSISVGSGINSASFLNGLIGVAASSTTIYVTEDGGTSWYELTGAPGGSNVVSVDCDSWVMAGTDKIIVIEPTRQVC